MTVPDQLVQRLQAQAIPFELLHHEPVYISEEEAARAIRR